MDLRHERLGGLKLQDLSVPPDRCSAVQPAPRLPFWQVWELEGQSPLCENVTIPRAKTVKAFFKSIAPVQLHCNRMWTMRAARPSSFFMPQLKQWQREVWSSSSPPQVGQSGLMWWVTLIIPTQRWSIPYHCAANYISINLYPITAPPAFIDGFQEASRAVSTQRQPRAVCHLSNKLRAPPVTCQRSSTFTVRRVSEGKPGRRDTIKHIIPLCSISLLSRSLKRPVSGAELFTGAITLIAKLFMYMMHNKHRQKLKRRHGHFANGRFSTASYCWGQYEWYLLLFGFDVFFFSFPGNAVMWSFERGLQLWGKKVTFTHGNGDTRQTQCCLISVCLLAQPARAFLRGLYFWITPSHLFPNWSLCELNTTANIGHK